MAILVAYEGGRFELCFAANVTPDRRNTEPGIKVRTGDTCSMLKILMYLSNYNCQLALCCTYTEVGVYLSNKHI